MTAYEVKKLGRTLYVAHLDRELSEREQERFAAWAQARFGKAEVLGEYEIVSIEPIPGVPSVPFDSIVPPDRIDEPIAVKDDSPIGDEWGYRDTRASMAGTSHPRRVWQYYQTEQPAEAIARACNRPEGTVTVEGHRYNDLHAPRIVAIWVGQGLGPGPDDEQPDF